MIRLYYEPATGNPLYTLKVQEQGFAPAGHWIEIENEPDNLAAYRVVDGNFILADLEPIKGELRSKLLAKVKELREPLVTNLPGQDMVYLRKEEEAMRFLADPDPDPDDYLLLNAEVGITAPTAYELAQIWLNMSVIWRQTAAQLEQFRLGTAAQIDAAETKEDLDLIADIINPPPAAPMMRTMAMVEPEPEPEVSLPACDGMRSARWDAMNRADKVLAQAQTYYLNTLPDEDNPSEEEYQLALTEQNLHVIALYELNQMYLQEQAGLHQDAIIEIEHAGSVDEIYEAVEKLQNQLRFIL